MPDIKIKGVGDEDIEGEYRHTPTTQIRPAGAKEQSVMGIEATVDATPQPLKKLRDFHSACKSIPAILRPEGQIVMNALFSCFERQKSVQEGLIGDLIWGFKQVGMADELTYNGLGQLDQAGYIKFQAPDGAFVDITSDQAKSAWVRYQPKLLEMVYER